MGWAGGSALAEDIWLLVERYIPKNQKKRVARSLITVFEDEDCDTITEATQLCADAQYEYDEDEEEYVYR